MSDNPAVHLRHTRDEHRAAGVQTLDERRFVVSTERRLVDRTHGCAVGDVFAAKDHAVGEGHP